MGLDLSTVFDPTVYPHAVVLCNLCGGNDVQVVATQDRYGFSTRIVRCDACGLEYQSPRMSADGFAALYRGKYRPLVQSWLHHYAIEDRSASTNTTYAEGLRYFARRWLPTTGDLLDVGGSTGMVSKHFAKHGTYAMTVLDPSPVEVAEAQGRRICQSVEDAQFPEHSFDVVLCCRTLDHCLDPKLALEQMRAWIRASGVLVCDVMNVSAWHLGSRYKLDHPYAFTAKTFGALLLLTGWRIRAIWKSDGQRYVGVVATPT